MQLEGRQAAMRWQEPKHQDFRECHGREHHGHDAHAAHARDGASGDHQRHHHNPSRSSAPEETRTPARQAVLDEWVHLGRVGRYEEFAAAIAFLCSADASYLSGSMLAVDGGFHRFNQL